MAYNYKPFFSKISIQGKGHDELSYTFSNGPIEQKNGSVTIFGVFSINSSQELYQYFIKQTVKHFVDFYHRAQSLPDNAQTAESGLNNHEFLFENAIQYIYDKVTTALIDFQEDHKRSGSIDLKKIHCIIGVLSEGTLYLSVTGGMLHSFYIYPTTNKQGFSRYSLAPIIDAGKNSEHQTRLFSQIVSGAVSLPDGVVCITTGSLLDYLSLEQLKQIVTTQHPDHLTLSLERILGRVQARNDLTALFIHPTYTGNAQMAQQQHRIQTASNRSMEELNSRQRGTDSVMTPATSFHVSHAISRATHLLKLCIQKIITLEKILFQPANAKKMRSFIHIIITALQRFGKHLINTARSIQRAITSRSYRNVLQSHAHLAPKMYSKFQAAYSSAKHTFLKLPKPSRIILSLSILFIVLFVTSLFTLSAQKKKQQHVASVETIIQSITDKSNSAEARVIFENDSAAFPLIQEMQQLIEHVPQPLTDKQQSSLVILRTKIASLVKRLNHAITIDSPEYIATLADIATAESVDATEYSGTILIASEQHFYSLSPGAKNPTHSTVPSSMTTSRCAAAIKNAIIACNGDGTRLYRLEQNSVSKPLPISLSAKEGRIDKIQTYNSNAYVYSASAATFFKHLVLGSGFGIGIEWVKDPSISLHDILDFDIDGSLYVLKSSNQLYQYVNGRPRPIPLPSIIPTPQSLTKIETDPSTPLLFLLEPRGNRIIVLDKKSYQLKAQLLSPVFSSLKDIQLRPSTKSLLVVNGADLLNIPLEKLK
ncbi:MAG: hypothetical protein AAB400_03285 [Patescibacteria group bacterium]